MSNVLEQLKLRRRHETVLRSGLKVAYHFPDIQECILAGQIPLPALRDGKEMTEEEATAQLTADPDAAKRGWEFKQRLVASMIEAIDGEDITEDDDRPAIVATMEPEERDELFILATERGGPGEA
jgi:hypothetical protein